MKKKLAALILGTLLALAGLEISLRVVAIRDYRARGLDRITPEPELAEMLARPRRILVLGNSYTAGDGAGPGESFPDQLQKIVDQEFPHRVAIFNRGRGNTNTRHILDSLEEKIEEIHPSTVVAMTGQPNHWNAYGYSSYLEESRRPRTHPWGLRIYNLLNPLRTFRLVTIIADRWTVEASPRAAMSNTFPDIALAEKEKLSLKWRSDSSDAHWLRHLNSEQAEEGLGVLTEVVKSHPDLRPIYATLGRLLIRKLHRNAEGLDWIRRGLTITPEKFSPEIFLFLQALQRNPASGPMPGLQKLIEAGRHGQPTGERRRWLLDWISNRKLPYDEGKEGGVAGNIAFLAEVAELDPSFSATYLSLAHHYQVKGDFAAAAAALEKGILADPAQSRVAMSRMLFDVARISRDPILQAKVESFLDAMRRTYPSMAWTLVNFSDEEEMSWVRFDLEKIHRATEAHGIPLVLQTYPPRRYADSGWPVDTLIRELHREEGIPLSDTEEELRRIFLARGAKESFYSFYDGAKDEHLNGKGYRLVAEILFRTLKENGFVP